MATQYTTEKKCPECEAIDLQRQYETNGQIYCQHCGTCYLFVSQDIAEIIIRIGKKTGNTGMEGKDFKSFLKTPKFAWLVEVYYAGMQG